MTRRGNRSASIRRYLTGLLDFSKKRAAMKLKYGGEFFPATAMAAVGVLYRDFFQKDKNGVRRASSRSIWGFPMISNERQYRITKAAAGKFKLAVRELDKNGGLQKGIHPRLVQAQRDAAQSQLEDLLEEIKEYEGLKAGNVPVIEMDLSTTCRMA